MSRHRWSPAEDRALRTLYPHIRSADVARILGPTITSIYRRAGKLRIQKSAAFLASPLNGRNIKGHAPNGARTRFRKGHVPWTKGQKGLRIPGSEKTWFKRGQPPAPNRSPADYPIGMLRENADGYIDIKIKQGPRAWTAFHRVLWEDAHGPLPHGHALIFRDGDKLNIDLANLALITRGELMRRNSIHLRLPQPLRGAVQLLGQLKRKIRAKTN